MKIKDYNLIILNRKKVSDDLYLLTADKPQGFDYLAGQFVMIQAEIKGQTVQRAYSLASHPFEKFLMFYIKKIPNGLMSNFLYQLPIDSQLRFSGPFGANTAKRLSNHTHITYIAAGCGIASVRSLVLDIKDKRVQTVVHQEKYESNLIWQDILNKYSRYLPILSRDDKDRSCWHGHVQDFMDEIAADNTSYVIVGPADFVTSVRAELARRRLNSIEIHVEQY